LVANCLLLLSCLGLALALLLLLLLLLLLYNKVAHIASLLEEGLHLNRPPQLGSVLSVQGSRGSGPARELDAVLLVDMLSHLLAIYSNVATATALLDCCCCCCCCCSCCSCCCSCCSCCCSCCRLVLTAEKAILRRA
jgi:hypothetical protein